VPRDLVARPIAGLEEACRPVRDRRSARRDETEHHHAAQQLVSQRARIAGGLNLNLGIRKAWLAAQIEA